MIPRPEQELELDLSIIPPAPQVLINLIDLFNQSDVNFQQMESIIKKDAALYSSVISIANSAAYSQWNGARELRQILVVLGTKTLKTITLTAAVHQFFSQFNEALGESMGRLWLDALICAHFSAKLANLIAYNNPDEAYLAGLLHQLGELVLLANHPRQYHSMLKQAADQASLLYDEQQNFGIQSVELAAQIIQGWQINSSLADAIKYQYKPVELVQDANSLVKLVNLASNLCNRLNHSNNHYQIEDQLFDLNQPVVEDLRKQAIASAIEDAKGFGINIGAQSEWPETNIDDENIRLALARKVRNIALLDGIYQQQEAFENTADMMKLVSENLQMLFGLSSCMFFYPDQQQSQLTGVACHGKHIQPADEFTIQLKTERSLIAQAALENRIFNSQEQKKFTELPVIDEQIKAALKSTQLICLPLVSQQKLMAVLAIGFESYQLNRLKGEQELLTHFSSVIANAILQQQQATLDLQDQQHLQLQEIRLQTRKAIHEINNPLTVINNYLEIIAMSLDQDSENGQHLETVRSEIDRVSSLLIQLRNEQTETLDNDTSQTSDLDINAVIKGLVKLYEPTFYKINKIKSQLELDDTLPLIKSDLNKIKQILSNLVKNAVESLPSKGVITIKTKALILINNKKYIQIIISDNGIGIPDSVVENLFSPVKTTKGAKHSGLGLTIVYRLISELQGSISYSISDSGGAEFVILLPRE